MHRSPLHQFHVDRGARLVEFAGWEMPLFYRGVHVEHQQVRRSGGLFDVSHMGRLHIAGRDATALLELACTRRIGDMAPGQCRYGLLCNEHGGVRDDCVVMRMDERTFLVVVNAANRGKIVQHLHELARRHGQSVRIDDRTLTTAMVAIQGPQVMALIGSIDADVAALKRYRFLTRSIVLAKATISRTGYTGEDGVEVIVPASLASAAVGWLTGRVRLDDPDAPIQPAGLAARDTLRLEAGMPLYGHELREDVSALSSGLTFAISMDKDDFVGKEALSRELERGGPARRLTGLTLQGRRTPRQGMPVLRAGRVVGEVTSGCLSPTLDRPIAIALVDAASAEPGIELEVQATHGSMPASTVPLPFYSAPKPSAR